MVSIPCSVCKQVYNISIPQEISCTVEKFPFPIVLMHVSKDGKKQVHTLIAYIDHQLRCRHVEYLVGKKVFITPYILYNPSLLQFQCNKTLTQVIDTEQANDIELHQEV